MPRPRSIPEDEALERALLLFWKKGYDRTSIADLSEAIGVGPSSIYNAFGSKAAIFRRVLDRYMAMHARSILEALEAGAEIRGEKNVEERIGEVLRDAARLYAPGGDFPLGCALLQGGGAGVPEESEACSITLDLKTTLEGKIRAVFEAAAARGEPLAASPRILAKHILATMRGLSQLACDGTSRDDLLAIAALAARKCVE